MLTLIGLIAVAKTRPRAADERDAIENAAKDFRQHARKLIAVRRG